MKTHKIFGITALLISSLIPSMTAATLSIDFNDNDDGPGNIQTGFSACTMTGTTVPSVLGAGGNVTVSFPVTDSFYDRDRGALTGGSGLPQSDLLRDFVFRSGTELVLELGTLNAGTYSFTGFFHDNDVQQVAGKLSIDRDGWNSGVLGVEEVVSSFVYSTGTAPATVGTASFTFVADGSNPVAVVVQSSAGGSVYVINGFTLTSVPEPSSAALLGFGGFALILRRRR